MNYSYGLQIRGIEHLEQMPSANPSPILFQEAFGKKRAAECFGKEQIRNKILGNLSPEILQSLSPHVEKIRLEKGQEICKADDSISHIYFPETAVTSEFQILADGKTTGVAMIGSEGLLGISALLGSQTSNNWVQTLAAGTAFKISVQALRQYFDYCRSMKINVLAYVNSYLTQISQRAVCNNHHQIVERLCGWILMLDDRCQHSGHPLYLTQEQLAFFLGAQRPSITTVTQVLREKGMIDYKRGKLLILDRGQLVLSACSCYAASK